MAIVEFAFIVASYGVLVFTADSDAEAFNRLLVTGSTMFVVVLLVSRLRGSLDASVGKLTHLADRDPLTGALNRRALLERASAEFARGNVTGEPVSVIAADLDNLKELNDGAGHAAGDLALRAVATTLVENTRDRDSVARVGGDEFVVLLPGASAEEARMVAHRLRSAPIHVDELAGDPVRLSVGVATGEADHPFDTIWRAADEALYRFKRHGGESLECVVLPREPLQDAATALA
jgi:diguanylate cyclase (GGDEF)-like protein